MANRCGECFLEPGDFAGQHLLCRVLTSHSVAGCRDVAVPDSIRSAGRKKVPPRSPIALRTLIFANSLPARVSHDAGVDPAASQRLAERWTLVGGHCPCRSSGRKPSAGCEGKPHDHGKQNAEQDAARRIAGRCQPGRYQFGWHQSGRYQSGRPARQTAIGLRVRQPDRSPSRGHAGEPISRNVTIPRSGCVRQHLFAASCHSRWVDRTEKPDPGRSLQSRTREINFGLHSGWVQGVVAQSRTGNEQWPRS